MTEPTVGSPYYGLRKHKMGAMKNLLIDAMDNVYAISRDLEASTEESDLDEMKQALRRAIVNSALAIAFIEELELIGYVEKSK